MWVCLGQTARSPRGQPSELLAPFEKIFAGNGAGSAGLLKETLAALRAAPNFPESAFPMPNAGIFPGLLFRVSRKNAPCPPRLARRLQNRGGALNNN